MVRSYRADDTAIDEPDLGEPEVDEAPTTGSHRLPRRPGPRRWVEVPLVVLGSAALAIGMTWPQLRDLRRTLPGDEGGPLRVAAQLAWASHTMFTHPTALWTSPAFLRSPDNVAYSDTTFGYGPLGLATGKGISGAVAQLNVATMISYLVAFVGAYALARALGSRVPGALVAGAGFAYAPWHLQQVTDLAVISTGGIALSLALLLRGHAWSLRHGWRPDRTSWALALLGWAVACWQLTLGFTLGVPFGYVLVLVFFLFALGWLIWSRVRMSVGLLLADFVGATAFALLVYLFSRPFLRVVQADAQARPSAASVEHASADWRGLLTAPTRSFWWGDLETAWRDHLGGRPDALLLPGFVLIGLAVLGVLASSWRTSRRVALVVATAVAVVLALGTGFPGGGRYTYLPLFHHLPGWDALTVPGRLVVWVTLGLCLLAAGFVSGLTDLALPRTRALDEQHGEHVAAPRPRGRAARVMFALLLVVPALVVTAEGYGTWPWQEVPRPDVSLGSLNGPVLVLPSSDGVDPAVMLWDVDGWPGVANGSGRYVPAVQQQIRDEASGFPDKASVQALRARGIHTVVLVRSWAASTRWYYAADRPVDGLGITRTDSGDLVVYRLQG